MFDLQKAGMWKRISAALFDFILLCILVTGIAFLCSSLTGYDTYNEKLQQAYEQPFFDEDTLYAYHMVINLTLMITTVSILLGYSILEFFIPLYMKDGRTLGKRIFGLALMRTDGVRITAPLLFIRTLLGKFTIETMIPVLILLMILFGGIGIPGTVILGLILLLQIIILFATDTNALIHDLLAKTTVVDDASQMMFDSEEALLEYKKKLHAEQVARQTY